MSAHTKRAHSATSIVNIVAFVDGSMLPLLSESFMMLVRFKFT